MSSTNWGATAINLAMECAASNGHKDAMNKCRYWGAEDLMTALKAAARGGQVAAMCLLESWGAKDFNRSLAAAAGSESVSDGLSAIVVDYFKSDDPDQERPYWTHIHDADLLETDHEDGVMVRVRWSEYAKLVDPEKPCEAHQVERIKVLYRGDPKASLASDERYARFETHAKKQGQAQQEGQEEWEALEKLYGAVGLTVTSLSQAIRVNAAAKTRNLVIR